MKKALRKTGVRPGDLFVIAAVLIAAQCSFFVPLLHSSGTGTSVLIRTETNEQTYPLRADREISVESAGYSLTVTFADGTVRVSSTDCPNAVCAATGAISAPGQSIVCAPARVLITIQSDGGMKDDKTPDAVIP